jgi:hypothetical protein
MTRADRISRIRAAHRRAQGTDERVERTVARVEVYAATAPEWDVDDLDEVASASVAPREACT